MNEHREGKVSDLENWALKRGPVRRHKHSNPLNRRSADLPVRQAEMQLKVPIQENLTKKKSLILPAIKEELSFQLDSSRKKQHDRLENPKLNVVRNSERSYSQNSFGSIRIKPMIEVSNKSVSHFKIFTEAEKLSSISEPKRKPKSLYEISREMIKRMKSDKL